MFILHSSNKTENLFQHLVTVIENQALSEPFKQEVFLIQSQGMERWLAQQLATHFKLWANFLFLFPAKFFSTMALQVDNRFNDQPFDRNALLWCLESMLRDLENPVFAPLQFYLSGNHVDLKRYQLAKQLAHVFDQYQIMRPDLLSQWQQQKQLYHHHSELWQLQLWQQLTGLLGERHRGKLWLDTIDTLQQAEAGQLSNSLPERIHVFGLNTMPPLFLTFLQALGQHSQVHFYLLNPAQSYWADLQSRRQKRTVPDASEQEVSDHPLLISLGQQGREFQQMLLENVQFELEVDSFEETQSDQLTNLQQLQDDILNNQLSQCALSKDESISIHACHSRLREVQVLKDCLLNSLESDQQLQLRDIVVMAPDIQQYEPFISAVFADIQHAIADRSMRINNVLLDLFIRFLRLSQSRFGWQEVLEFLQEPLIYLGFALSENDLELIAHWVEQLNVRWGQSGDHKAKLNLPALSENTWQMALDRLLMGYAVGDDSDFVADVLPFIEIEGTSALVLGGLNDYIQLLFKAAKELSQEKSLQVWSEQLYHYTQILFANSDVEANELHQLNELFTDLGQQFNHLHQHPVSLDVMINCLEDAIQERKSATGFLRGQLTFCSMLPMRSIPFKVIALLGMNEGEFPKINSFPSFDLIGENYRQGDRSSRADDRYQFLEILLSARKQLIITFIGLSNQNNEKKQPSVVINEMLEILHHNYQLETLVDYHPLQAFNERYFQQHSDLFSYSHAANKTAIALTHPPKPASLWWNGRKTKQQESLISLFDVNAFYRHPQHFFLHQKMALRLDKVVLQAEEREPFKINGLEKYALEQDWINSCLQGQALSLSRLQAQGGWLAGSAGAIAFESKKQELSTFVELIRSKQLGLACTEINVDLNIGNYQLSGVINGIYEQGSLFYRYADLKGKDLMLAWIHHLLVNQIKQQSTYLISRDQDLLFKPEFCQSQDLLRLLELFELGLSSPKAFFVEAAFAYVQQALKINESSRSTKSALDIAIEKFSNTLENGYDPELNLVCRGVQDVEQLLDENFVHLCENLILPIWEKLNNKRI